MARAAYDPVAAEASRKATLEALHTQLAERVGSLDSVEAWQAWLGFATSFHRYSFNNTVLIWTQRPDATLVAGYRAWQAKGRQVRRGEPAIRVLGPVTVRDRKVDEQGRPVMDATGKPIVQVRVVGVKPVSVFDVSQTDGDPLPEAPRSELLTGQAPPGLWDALQGFVEAQGYAVVRGDCGGANGLSTYDAREVRVRDDIDEAQAVKTLAHEAGHVLLHAPESREGFACRGVWEVEAESVAYLVTAAHGLDASQYTFNYVAGWAHDAATPDGPSVEDLVKATGQRVIGATEQILQATKPAPTLVDDALGELAVQVSDRVDAAAVMLSVVAPKAEVGIAGSIKVVSPSELVGAQGNASVQWEVIDAQPLLPLSPAVRESRRSVRALRASR